MATQASWTSLSSDDVGWRRDRFVQESRFFSLDRAHPVFGFALGEVLAKLGMVLASALLGGVASSLVYLSLSLALLGLALRRKPVYSNTVALR